MILPLVAVLAGLGLYLVYLALRPSPRPDPADIAELEAQTYATFRSRKLIPIVDGSQHAVGSVFTVDSARWLYRPSDCFKDLPAPETTGGTLPAIKLSTPNMIGIGLGIGIGKILDGKIDSSRNVSVQMQFSEVRVLELPESDLRRTYKDDACPEIKSMMQSTKAGAPHAKVLTPARMPNQ